MTRTELVKKLTSSAAVDEEYAALFMETFLMQLHQRLHEYDTFSLPLNIVFAQQKIVKNNEEFYLITCDSTDPADPLKEDLVFAVPSTNDELQLNKYSVFSIGIAKQIIPTKEMVASGFVFEPGFSLKKYFRGKAENLLQSGKFESKKTEESDFAWNFTAKGNDNQFSTDASLHEEISKEVQEFSWDFGNNWKRELQEEEILSVEPFPDEVFEPKRSKSNEKINTKETEEPIEWVFNNEETKESVEWDFHEEVASDTYVAEDEKLSQTKIEEVNFSKLHEKLDKGEAGAEYQEVKVKTQELSIDLSEFEKLFDSDTKEDEPESRLQEDEPLDNVDNRLDDEYLPVRSTSEFVLTQEQENLLAETDPFSNFTVEKSDLGEQNLFQDLTINKNITSFPLERTHEEEAQIHEEEPLTAPERTIKRERGSLFWFIISVVLIIVIFVFLYWKMWGIPPWLKLPNQTGHVEKSKPVIIEREYDVPVTYPYEVKITEAPKPEQVLTDKNQKSPETKMETTSGKTPVVKTELEASDIFSKNNPNNQIVKIKQTSEKISASKSTAAEIKDPYKKKDVNKQNIPATRKAALLKDNIYLEGSTYVVQLSSWKSESIADLEVARLRRKGVKAFKSSVLLQQKGGTWYRVKVGGFSSAEDASRFYNSIK